MRPRPQPQVVTVAGYGVSITVKRGHLVVEDGVGTDRRVRRFNRAMPRFDRLVVHGHSGVVSLDALRWINDVGASFIHIDHNANVLTTSTPGHQAEPQYLVAQVESRTNGRGFAVMRRLITEKIDGQLENLQVLGAQSRTMRLTTNHRERAANAQSFKELRDAEKLSGKQYWMAWRGIPVRFDPPALKRIPGHWVRFNRRRSTLTPGNRKAVDPPNALLNYLFGVLEAEIKLTTLGVGLNPHLGMLHADLPFRPSLAADLMEPLRPQVERQVLSLLRARTFSGREFFETREGQCRLVPPVTNEITEALYAGLPDLRKMTKEVRDQIAVR